MTKRPTAVGTTGPLILRRRQLGRLALGAALIGVPAARGNAEDLGRVTLHIGDQKAGLRALLELSGGIEDLPYKIEWSEFPAAAPILEALNAGALDAGYTGDLAFLSVYAVGAPIRAIGGTRSRPQSQVILARGDGPVRTIQDLKGRRVAGNRGGWGHFLIRAALEQAGIAPEEVTIAYLGPVDARAAFVSGAVDAWAVWEPYVSIAVLNDGARALADGSGLTPTITFVVANQDAIRTKHAALADLLRRLDAGWQWADANVPSYVRYNAALTGLSEPVTRRAYDNRRTVPIAITDAVVEEVQQAADRSYRFGILSKKLDVAQAVDRSFAAAEHATH